MKSFADYNPIAVFGYYFAVTLAAMLCMNPLILSLSLVGAVTFVYASGGGRRIRDELYTAVFFILIVLINPIFNHNGASVLFILNNNPVTLEAVLFGIAAGVMIIAVIYWFRSFSAIMTSDRLLYIFGSFLPKVSLILSMTLRYIPLFKKQLKKTSDAQKAMGLACEDNVIDRVRGGIRVFSVMVTWALENGIITADSMAARGYATGRRTNFALYRFRRADALLVLLAAVLSGVFFGGMAAGALDFDYYPRLAGAEPSVLGAVSYSAYALLAFLPAIIEAEERIKWKFLQSKI